MMIESSEYDLDEFDIKTDESVLWNSSTDGGYKYLGILPDDLSVYDSLHEHQKIALLPVFELTEYDRGLYFVLETGFGKTHLIAGLVELSNKLGTTCIIICPKAVSPHIMNIVAGYKLDMPKIVHFKSNSLLNELKTFSRMNRNITYLVDEAHNLISEGGQKIVKFLQTTIGRFGKIYLFTATPIKKHLSDLYLVTLCWPVRMVGSRGIELPEDNDDFDALYKTNVGGYDISPIVDLVRPFIIHLPTTDLIPQIVLSDHMKVPLSKYDSHQQYKVPVNFSMLTGIRRDGELQINKIKKIADITKIAQRPIVVFTKYINVLYKRSIDKDNEVHDVLVSISHEFIVMNMSDKMIADKIRAFNSVDNVYGDLIKLLFIGPGMTEGIEFYMTDQTIIMAPLDDLRQYKQIIGRSARPQSLVGLSRDDRKITVTCFYSVYDEDFLNEHSEIVETYEQIMEKKMMKLEMVEEYVKLIFDNISLTVDGGSYSNTDSTALTWMTLNLP